MPISNNNSEKTCCMFPNSCKDSYVLLLPLKCTHDSSGREKIILQYFTSIYGILQIGGIHRKLGVIGLYGDYSWKLILKPRLSIISQNFKFILRIIFPRNLFIIFSCAFIWGDLNVKISIDYIWVNVSKIETIEMMRDNQPCSQCCSLLLHTCEPVSLRPSQIEEQQTVSALLPEKTIKL